MTNTIEFIENYWKHNECNNLKPKEILQLISPKECPNLYIGYNELGNRCLFLKTDLQNFPKIDNEKTNIALKISEENSIIYIELSDNYFGEIFNDLIISLFNKIKNIPISESKFQFIALFNKWNELFKNKFKKDHLSENELLGLLGELVYLKEKLTEAEDPFQVNEYINSWSGPDGNANDFIFSDLHVEVKSIEQQKQFVNISSEFQLNNLELPIHLLVYKTVRTQDGFSLVDLVNDIRDLIENKIGDLDCFLLKLNQYNIDFKSTNFYEDFKICITDKSLYNTNDVDFPKISADNIYNGIFNVKYKISLKELLKYKIN